MVFTQPAYILVSILSIEPSRLHLHLSIPDRLDRTAQPFPPLHGELMSRFQVSLSQSRLRWAVLASLFVVFGRTAPAATVTLVDDPVVIGSLLGTGAIFEDFDAFTVADGTTKNLFTDTLDSTTVARGQGPSLVETGLRFEVPQGLLNWNGTNYENLPDRSIVGFNTDTLEIHFDTPTNVVGLEVNEFQSSPDFVTVRVFDGGGGLAATFTGLEVTNPAGRFIGLTSTAGISKIELVNTVNNAPPKHFSPVLAGMSSGIGTVTAVPEPSTAALLALIAGGGSVLRRTRKPAVSKTAS